MRRLGKTERLENRLLLSRRPSNVVEEPTVEPIDPEVAITIIGDSITAGITAEDAAPLGIPPRASYRPVLWQHIEDRFDGESVGFVGPSDYNTDGLAAESRPHTSYRGYGALNYLPNETMARSTDPHGIVSVIPHYSANGWATFAPDVAIILLGANDLISNRRVAGPKSIESSLQGMITALRTENDGVQILLGTMPENRHVEVVELNAMISDLVEPTEEWSGSTAQSKIHIVDHYHGTNGIAEFDRDVHTVDGLHPTPEGDEILAANWWSTLEPVIEELLAGSGGDQIVAEADPVGADPNNQPPNDTADDSISSPDSSEATNPDDVPLDGVPTKVEDDPTSPSDEAANKDADETPDDTIPAEVTTPVVTISTSTLFLTEGQTARLKICRTGPVDQDLELDLTTSGSADPLKDYLLAGSVVIPAGSSEVNFDVQVLNDQVDEGYEAFTIEIASAAGYEVNEERSSATVRVRNIDAAPATTNTTESGRRRRSFSSRRRRR